MNPAPTITTSSPSAGAVSSTALTTHESGSATAGNGRPGGTFTQERSCATSSSAKPPPPAVHTTTWSPGASAVASVPVSSTTPAIS